MDALVPIDGMVPPRYRALLPYSHFNRVQSRLVATVLNRDVSVVVAAPTGTGKTGA